MNAYADMLFSTLLGWVRGLMQQLWSFFSSGGSGGFFAWLGDHFLPVTAVLCLLGAAADLVWRIVKRDPSPVVRELGKLVYGERDMGRADRMRFEQGYEDGIDMQDINPDGADHIPLFESNYAQDPVSSDALIAELDSFVLSDEAQPAAGAETARTWDTGRQETEMRRRRGDRYENHERKRLFRRVNSLISDDEEGGLLDRLPTQVDRKGAFHDPVYPHRRA